MTAVQRGVPKHTQPRCKAHSRQTGRPCGNRPMNGQAVCRMHGGSTKAARAKAQERILATADVAARHLIEFMTDKRVPYPVRLTAARDLLDRAGLSAKTGIEVEVTAPWEAIIADIIVDPSALPATAGQSHDGVDDDIVDAEVVEDGPAQPVPLETRRPSQGGSSRKRGRRTGGVTPPRRIRDGLDGA